MQITGKGKVKATETHSPEYQDILGVREFPTLIGGEEAAEHLQKFSGVCDAMRPTVSGKGESWLV